MAGLGGVVVGDDVELLDAFHGEVLHQSTDDQVLVVATVHVGVNLTAIAAVDADVAHAGFSRVKPLSLAYTGNQGFQSGEIAVQDRERGQLGRRYRADYGGGGSLNHWRLARHLDHLGRATWLQGLVHSDCLADQKQNSFLLHSREARGLHLHAVGSRRQEREGGIAEERRVWKER